MIGPDALLTAVTDEQIRTALRWLFREHGLVAEGAGAAGAAAVLAGLVEPAGRLVVVLSGRNITVPAYTAAISPDSACPCGCTPAPTTTRPAPGPG